MATDQPMTGAAKVVLPDPPYCPKCQGRLYINEGYDGKTYFCAQCKDITLVVRQWQMDTAAGKTSATRPGVHRSYVATGPLPAEIPRWSWAAFGFSWIWLLARGLYVWAIIQLVVSMFFVLLCAILWLLAPIILSIFAVLNLIWCVIIGFEGNTLDWQHGQYANAYAFRRSHRRWFITMKIILWILIVEGMALVIVLMYQFFSGISGG